MSARTDESVGRLVADATEDVAQLVRDEVALAKHDLATTGKRFGLGVGLFGAAATVAWFGVATLVAAAVLGLAEVWAPWLAALAVAGVLLVAAGAAALLGKGSIARAPEPPQRRVRSVRDDVAAVTHPRAEEAR